MGRTLESPVLLEPSAARHRSSPCRGTGQGQIRVVYQVLAGVHLTCEVAHVHMFRAHDSKMMVSWKIGVGARGGYKVAQPTARQLAAPHWHQDAGYHHRSCSGCIECSGYIECSKKVITRTLGFVGPLSEDVMSCSDPGHGSRLEVKDPPARFVQSKVYDRPLLFLRPLLHMFTATHYERV